MNITSFKEITEIVTNKVSECSLFKQIDGKNFVKLLEDYDKPLGNFNENIKGCPIEGSNGTWDGERGNSVWHPNRDHIPPDKTGGYNNPDKKTWGEILDKYGIDGIPYKDGEPDFSEVSKGNVEIKPFSENRRDNFDKADIELAKQKGCTPEEVAQWRKENGYTWHECKDQKTMQKVPHEIHANVGHSGGISESKKGSGEE